MKPVSAEEVGLGTGRKSRIAAAKKLGMTEDESLLGHEEKETSLQSFLAMVREWRIWWLALIWAIVSYGMDGLIFWIPLLIQ